MLDTAQSDYAWPAYDFEPDDDGAPPIYCGECDAELEEDGACPVCDGWDTGRGHDYGAGAWAD